MERQRREPDGGGPLQKAYDHALSFAEPKVLAPSASDFFLTGEAKAQARAREARHVEAQSARPREELLTEDARRSFDEARRSLSLYRREDEASGEAVRAQLEAWFGVPFRWAEKHPEEHCDGPLSEEERRRAEDAAFRVSVHNGPVSIKPPYLAALNPKGYPFLAVTRDWTGLIVVLSRSLSAKLFDRFLYYAHHDAYLSPVALEELEVKPQAASVPPCQYEADGQGMPLRTLQDGKDILWERGTDSEQTWVFQPLPEGDPQVLRPVEVWGKRTPQGSFLRWRDPSWMWTAAGADVEKLLEERLRSYKKLEYINKRKQAEGFWSSEQAVRDGVQAQLEAWFHKKFLWLQPDPDEPVPPARPFLVSEDQTQGVMMDQQGNIVLTQASYTQEILASFQRTGQASFLFTGQRMNFSLMFDGAVNKFQPSSGWRSEYAGDGMPSSRALAAHTCWQRGTFPKDEDLTWVFRLGTAPKLLEPAEVWQGHTGDTWVLKWWSYEAAGE